MLSGMRVANRRVPVRVLNRLWHRLAWPPVELLIKGPFDIAHSPHPLLLPTRDAARVVTIHDLDFLVNPERTRGEVRRDYPALVRRHAQLADHVIVNSAYTAGEVHRVLDVPMAAITVCRGGAPPWTPRREPPAEGHILFVGTLEPRKNVGGLLDGYERLLASRADAPPLVLMGRSTPAAAPWLERLRGPALANRVRQVGYVSDAARRQLYEQARLLVLPSFEEGFGLPVVEAMTMGVPVVASDRGAIPEVLGDAGLLVEPDDPDALADAMERLLFDTRLAAQATARGIRRATGFSWDASAVALHAGYAQAFATRRMRRTLSHAR
jgi:glycosyltransferase involved in cell wall biosynthesis